MNIHKCDEQDFDRFYPIVKSETKRLQILKDRNILYCIDPNQNLTNLLGSKIDEMNKNIQMDKKKLNRENRNLKDLSPSNKCRKINPQMENNQRSKSRNSSELINKNKNYSNVNRSKL